MADRKPIYDVSIFKKRRERLASRLGKGSVLVLPAHPEMIRNNDVHHSYRQDTNMMYLTGFEEPGSIFVFRPGCTPESILFVRPKNPAMETWDGFRFGPELTKSEFGVDATYEDTEFEDVMPELLVEANSVHYNLFFDSQFDLRLQDVLLEVKALRGRSGRGIVPIEDSISLLGELRIHKSEDEIELMRKAAHLSGEAHIEVMKKLQPGMNERAVHGLFIQEVMSRGAAREGYGTIVAGGDNATTLHYVFNDQPLKDGELLLIDGGGEYKYYTGDITRTYPINGKFTEAQKRIYQSVLDLQKSLVAAVKPGISLADLQKTATDWLIDLMIDEKVLKGSRSDILEKKSYQKYYPHGIGHWLGSDVHDGGLAKIDDQPRRLEPGMCFTIEPGIYLPENDESLPRELRGIGIRIEDNILVTEGGHENMTSHVPKEVDELESIVGSLK